MDASHNAPAIPLKEFDEEMKITRGLLERLPEGQGKFKPHEKSMEFGYLGVLVASIPGWIHETLRKDVIDLAAEEAPGVRSTQEILHYFDDKVKEARESLQEVTGTSLAEDWSLKHGETTLMTMPRGEASRQHLSHLIHHRGQLSVYERLLDVKLPEIYGPTADTKWQAHPAS